jgi:hypothetical protein
MGKNLNASLLGGEIHRHTLGDWEVSWESHGDYRHWCTQRLSRHSRTVLVVMKNPGSLSGNGSNLKRDTTLRILRGVGEQVGFDQVVLNLFDFASPKVSELYANWTRKDRAELVYGHIDHRSCCAVIYAHGDWEKLYHQDFVDRISVARKHFKALPEITIPTTKAGNPVHPMNWQRNGLLPEVLTACQQHFSA